MPHFGRPCLTGASGKCGGVNIGTERLQCSSFLGLLCFFGKELYNTIQKGTTLQPLGSIMEVWYRVDYAGPLLHTLSQHLEVLGFNVASSGAYLWNWY